MYIYLHTLKTCTLTHNFTLNTATSVFKLRHSQAPTQATENNSVELSEFCRMTQFFLLWEHTDLTVQSIGWSFLATHHIAAPPRGLHVTPVPRPWQLAHLHGLSDSFYVLLGFLHPILQIIQYLPHLLDVLKHTCNTKHKQSDPGKDPETCTLFLDGLGAPWGGPAPLERVLL